VDAVAEASGRELPASSDEETAGMAVRLGWVAKAKRFCAEAAWSAQKATRGAPRRRDGVFMGGSYVVSFKFFRLQALSFGVQISGFRPAATVVLAERGLRLRLRWVDLSWPAPSVGRRTVGKKWVVRFALRLLRDIHVLAGRRKGAGGRTQTETSGAE
jgi:hypothetical protein